MRSPARGPTGILALAPARSIALAIALLGFAAMPATVHAQNTLPLEGFVQQVARLWAASDVDALVALVPENEGLLLDAGAGIEAANSLHAAAALRALFTANQTVEAKPVSVTVASTSPPRGFGELAWTFRLRGAPGEQSRTVYVAAMRVGPNWRITELRLMDGPTRE